MRKVIESLEKVDLIDLPDEQIVEIFGGCTTNQKNYGELLIEKVRGPRVLILENYVHVGTVVEVGCAIVTDSAFVESLFAEIVVADKLVRLGSVYAEQAVVLSQSAVASAVKANTVIIQDNARVVESIEAQMIISSSRNPLPPVVSGVVVEV